MFLNQNNKVQLYLDDICSQIRFREAHQEIRLEIESHIQIKIQELLVKGLTEDEAVDQAISQMGEATLVGKQLNTVHQSKPEWSIIILSLLFISLGLLSMVLIGKQGLSMGVPILSGKNSSFTGAQIRFRIDPTVNTEYFKGEGQSS
ncbi:MAG: permease prefix domain 1-containing protein [Bacillota bacterium]